jgi:C4-type Zn-finger protein
MRESETLTCPECRKPMKLVRTIPHLGVIPALLVFYCAACKEVETREEHERAA